MNISTLPSANFRQYLREKRFGKGYLRRSAFRPLALGMRDNTRITVTVREELFSI